ncbi:hypothetical protein SNOG_13977 [Parastagonospora nodorum SN15]|uniref:Uncharacterized protein n=1 Tax=Phaeosphaeria nodorum (strain SN15 / ATCC MYA-4574 / FGSC 10173) TaxID=321614 RepID=Q0U2V9_PHANO|nr:hypothetical protein SNOG_13977 [Parastagonospora nodorum SN15]EAT78602.1 hypothetical protein SNOG_13977 [Parastagonospora nodorum SN15]
MIVLQSLYYTGIQQVPEGCKCHQDSLAHATIDYIIREFITGSIHALRGLQMMRNALPSS